MNPLTPIVEQVSSYYQTTLDWPIQPNPEAYADSLIKVLILPSSSKDLLIDRLQNLDNETTTPPTLSIVATPEPSPETAKTVVEPARKISPSKLRYFVIGGAFGNLKNALKLKKQLNKAGYSAAFVVEPSANEDLYKVAAVAYNSPNKAYAATQQVSLQTGATAWVMKRK
jgi:cell division septation protein DedD